MLFSNRLAAKKVPNNKGISESRLIFAGKFLVMIDSMINPIQVN